MSDRTIPFKIAIYEYACQKDISFTVKDILRDLAPIYGGERQFNANRIDEYLRSFLGIKFLTEEQLELDNKGELEIHYRITDYGKTRMKFIPKH